jgi:2-dehydrotetronate isomerase
MVKFAANLSMLFTEVDFLDRFQKAEDFGFRATEYLFPYAYEPDLLAGKLKQHKLKQELFNLPPGNWEKGEKGLVALPERRAEFEQSLETALVYAKALDCRKLHVMAGVLDPQKDFKIYEDTFIKNFRIAADFFEPYGIMLLIEPLNVYSAPDYFIAHQAAAVELIKKIERENVKLQFDLFHAQIMDGDITRMMHDFKSYIGHIQVASVPNRHEPVLGEMNFRYFCDLIDEINYQDYIGLEYNPKTTTEEGLSWLKDFRQ